MSIGYIIDVYREKVKAEKDFVSYALFVSFFSIILSGPIERAGNLLPQFKSKHLKSIRFDLEKIRDGFVRMLWGYFQKLVLADRIAIAVNTVYDTPENYGGAMGRSSRPLSGNRSVDGKSASKSLYNVENKRRFFGASECKNISYILLGEYCMDAV